MSVTARVIRVQGSALRTLHRLVVRVQAVEAVSTHNYVNPRYALETVI